MPQKEALKRRCDIREMVRHVVMQPATEYRGRILCHCVSLFTITIKHDATLEWSICSLVEILIITIEKNLDQYVIRHD